jgi:outer membrane protein assembly factor BamB
VTYEQERVLGGILILLASTLALASWILLAAPCGWRGRLGLLLVLILLVASGAGLVKVRGYTGDLRPILAWRFSSPGTKEHERESKAPPSDSLPPDFAWTDSSQFLGSNRLATYEAVTLERDWKTHAPRELWRRPVGAAWSSFAVVGPLAITQEQDGKRETVRAYGVLDGESRWEHAHEARYANELAGVGPRATPTVVGDRVYAVGGTGILCCLELENGTEVWSVDLIARAGGAIPMWGYSASPLVEDGRVILSAGEGGDANLVALDADTGALLWTARAGGPSYASAVSAVLLGRPQILSLNARTLTAHAPEDGSLLWRTDWDFPNPVVCQPLVVGEERVFVSSGYGSGCASFRISARDAQTPSEPEFSATREWKSLALKSKFSTFVQRAGHVYGFDDGTLACIDLADGKRVWKGGRYGHGQLVLAGDLLLIVDEEGELILVPAEPVEPVELARHAVLSVKTWNTPAFAPPLLLVRNDEEAVCIRLSPSE